MKTFKLEIKLGNNAMQTGNDVANTLVSIIDVLAYSLRELELGEHGYVYDGNGNCVGSWIVSEKE